MSKNTFTLYSDLFGLIADELSDLDIWKTVTKDYPKLGRKELTEEFLPSAKELLTSGRTLVIEQFHLAAREHYFAEEIILALEKSTTKEPDEIRELLGWVKTINEDNGMRKMKAIKDIVEHLDDDEVTAQARELFPSEYKENDDDE